MIRHEYRFNWDTCPEPNRLYPQTTVTQVTQWLMSNRPEILADDGLVYVSDFDVYPAMLLPNVPSGSIYVHVATRIISDEGIGVPDDVPDSGYDEGMCFRLSQIADNRLEVSPSCEGPDTLDVFICTLKLVARAWPETKQDVEDYLAYVTRWTGIHQGHVDKDWSGSDSPAVDTIDVPVYHGPAQPSAANKKIGQSRDGMRGRTSDSINAVAKRRTDSVRNGRIAAKFMNACRDVQIDPKTVKRWARPLFRNWDNPDWEWDEQRWLKYQEIGED